MVPRSFISKTGCLFQRRNVSILSALESSPVLVSASKDVYTNLALEQWLYTNLNYRKNHGKDTEVSDTLKHPVVLIWTDEPSIVIGRHQNPWVESNIRTLSSGGVKLARRHSGGGCVFHDENNINISIIGERKLFENRQGNLKFLAKVLLQKYGIECEPTKRHDLIHSSTGLKLSGSAAKLGQWNSYHHFTLLVDTNKEKLYSSIRQEQPSFITTNSSVSHRSKVINLREIKKDLEVNQVINDLANEYKKFYLGAKIINPGDQLVKEKADLKDLDRFKSELESWNWIYGMTPKFKIEKSFTVTQQGLAKKITFYINVCKGLFEDIKIETDLVSDFPLDRFEYLKGTRFSYIDAMVNITKLLKIEEGPLTVSDLNEQLFTTFLLQIIQETNS